MLLLLLIVAIRLSAANVSSLWPKWPQYRFLSISDECQCLPYFQTCALEAIELSIVASFSPSFSPLTCWPGTRLCCQTKIDKSPTEKFTERSRGSQLSGVMVKVVDGTQQPTGRTLASAPGADVQEKINDLTDAVPGTPRPQHPANPLQSRNQQNSESKSSDFTVASEAPPFTKGAEENEDMDTLKEEAENDFEENQDVRPHHYLEIADGEMMNLDVDDGQVIGDKDDEMITYNKEVERDNVSDSWIRFPEVEESGSYQDVNLKLDGKEFNETFGNVKVGNDDLSPLRVKDKALAEEEIASKKVIADNDGNYKELSYSLQDAHDNDSKEMQKPPNKAESLIVISTTNSMNQQQDNDWSQNYEILNTTLSNTNVDNTDLKESLQNVDVFLQNSYSKSVLASVENSSFSFFNEDDRDNLTTPFTDSKDNFSTETMTDVINAFTDSQDSTEKVANVTTPYADSKDMYSTKEMTDMTTPVTSTEKMADTSTPHTDSKDIYSTGQMILTLQPPPTENERCEYVLIKKIRGSFKSKEDGINDTGIPDLNVKTNYTETSSKDKRKDNDSGDETLEFHYDCSVSVEPENYPDITEACCQSNTENPVLLSSEESLKTMSKNNLNESNSDNVTEAHHLQEVSLPPGTTEDLLLTNQSSLVATSVLTSSQIGSEVFEENVVNITMSTPQEEKPNTVINPLSGTTSILTSTPTNVSFSTSVLLSIKSVVTTEEEILMSVTNASSSINGVSSTDLYNANISTTITGIASGTTRVVGTTKDYTSSNIRPTLNMSSTLKLLETNNSTSIHSFHAATAKINDTRQPQDTLSTINPNSFKTESVDTVTDEHEVETSTAGVTSFWSWLFG